MRAKVEDDGSEKEAVVLEIVLQLDTIGQIGR